MFLTSAVKACVTLTLDRRLGRA